MHSTGTILAGSSVVWLLQRCPASWTPKDLDIYTPVHKSNEVIDYLTDQGYIITDRFGPFGGYGGEDDPDNGLLTITKLEKGDMHIDVLESLADTAKEPIAFFHSTAVMNYISAGSINILYPNLFYNNYCAMRKSGDDEKWKEKYSSRSFQMVYMDQVPTYLLPGSGLCRSMRRKFKDRFSLTVAVSALLEDGTRCLFEEPEIEKDYGWDWFSEGNYSRAPLSSVSSHEICCGHDVCMWETYNTIKSLSSEEMVELASKWLYGSW
jgi:hypothetical protein